MPKYRVSIPYIAYVQVKLEAEDEEQATELAIENSQPMSLVGNGGWNKMIGVSNAGGKVLSIECTDGCAEGRLTLEVETEEIDDDEFDDE